METIYRCLHLRGLLNRCELVGGVRQIKIPGNKFEDLA